jgi:hypothetical protein
MLRRQFSKRQIQQRTSRDACDGAQITAEDRCDKPALIGEQDLQLA